MTGMGCFDTSITVENPARRGERRDAGRGLVDTGSEFTWIRADDLRALGIQPERVEHFIVADGREIARDVGYAIVHVDGRATNDDVVFAEPEDMVLLGARSLEGLNLRVDAQRKQLVPAGPVRAAAIP
jgi:predicted aspartyl protease